MQSSYRQMMKATSIFGGVQIFNIIISVVRSKIVAVLLGPTGIGLMGLFQTALSLIISATNFGLGSSAVRDVAQANNTNDLQKINQIVSVFRKLVWITGLLGLVLTIALAPLLSKFTFGHFRYTTAFVALSVTVLMAQLATGQTVVLQGLRKITWLAKASMYGSIAGLLVSVPLYYFYGTDGIVPALILSAITLFSVQYWFSRKVKIDVFWISLRGAIHQGKPMLKLGFMMSLSGLVSVAASYIIRIYISNTGTVEDVGLYNAGFAIIGTYVGLIFTAMGTDYYPKLAAVAHSNDESRVMINQQAELAIIILAPIILIFIVFINWVVIILYSEQFFGVNNMVLYAALGMFFKAASWAVGFLFLAKGAAKVFFWSEVVANFYLLIFNILGYKYFGLTGLGISFMIGYFLVLLQVSIISKIKYNFFYSLEFTKIFCLQLLLCVICLAAVLLLHGIYRYVAGTGFIIVSTIYSLRELNNRLNFKGFLGSRKK